MKILRKYIAKTVSGSILIVLLVLLGMDLFIQFLNEVDTIGQGDYGVLQAVFIALLNLPQSVYQFFPMAGLVGCLMGLGNLASSSELIIMRASGVSVIQIMFSVLRATIIILVVVTFIGEYLGPKALKLSEQRRTFYISGGKALTTGQGIWWREGSNFIIINSALDATHLQGLLWYSFNHHQQLIQSGAASAANFSHNQWLLKNVALTDFHGTNSITVEKKKELYWNIGLNPAILTHTQETSDEMNLKNLYTYVRYRHKNGLQSSQFDLALWQRLLQPLATLVMIFLAIPFIFGPLRTVTMGLRMVAGIGAGLCFYFFNQFFGPFSMVYQLPALAAASIPIMAFALFGFWLYKRAQ